MNCLFYDYKMQKKVPCSVVPGRLNVHNNINHTIYMCEVSYDETSLSNYGVTLDQVNKYCSENINIHELYPAEDQEDIDYFNDCIDNHNVDKSKELKRFEKLYLFITNIDQISTTMIYQLCNLIITDLQFKYLNHNEKIFMRSLSEIVYAEKPDIIYAAEFVRMINNLFNKYKGTDVFDIHRIDNINDIIAYKQIFPLVLNVVNIKNNVQFLSS